MAHAVTVDVAVLRRRGHPHPRRGGCLVEMASTLPGGRWTDRPGCVDPVLAATARAVNDNTRADEARRRLLVLAPWLVTGGQVGAGGSAAALGALAGHLIPDRTDAVADAVADAAAGGGRGRRQATALIRTAVGVLAGGTDADAALFRLFAAAENVIRDLGGLPPVDVDPADGAELPETLPVLVEIRVPHGAESMYYHCSALTELWPATLRAAWHRRQSPPTVPADSPRRQFPPTGVGRAARG